MNYGYKKVVMNYQKQEKGIFISDNKCHVPHFLLFGEKKWFAGRGYQKGNEQKEGNACGWFHVAQLLQKSWVLGNIPQEWDLAENAEPSHLKTVTRIES